MIGLTSESNERTILLLADDSEAHAAVVVDHIAALRASRHSVDVINPIGHAQLDLRLANYDVIVIHWSLVASWDSYLAPQLRAQIAAFPGVKIQFIQDEHRWVNASTAITNALGIDVLFTVLPNSAIEVIYGERLPHTEIVPTLTGFVPKSLVDIQSDRPSARPVDIGYRGRPIPFWMGRLTYEKAAIGRDVLKLAQQQRLTCDIAWREEDRIYGERWLAFLKSCRACLGTPSGASIADFDGSVERAVREYISLHPVATFEEVEANVLGPYEGNVKIDVISPRIFEAAATRTALVLFDGAYNGILERDVHYLALERDYRNFEEIAAKIRDESFLVELTERVHRDLIGSGAFSYHSFTSDFDRVVDRVSSEHGSRTQSDSQPVFDARAPTRATLVSGVKKIARNLRR